MIVYKRKGKLDQEWQEFLNQTNGSLTISLSCLLKIAEKFPELLEITEGEFTSMVKEGKPIYIFNSLTKQVQGIVIRNEKLAFVVSFDSHKIMTVFKFKPQTVKRLTINPKGGPKGKKSAYHRPSAKINALKEIEQEL